MAVAITISVLAVLLGAGVGAISHGRQPALSALRTFAIAAVLALVVFQLVPDSTAELGFGGLAVFGVALVLPSLVVPLLRRIHGHLSVEQVGNQLGYLGVAVHQFAESLALGTYATAPRSEPYRELIIAVAAHTIPLIAVVVASARRTRGHAEAIRRTAVLVLTTLVGFAAANWLNESVHERVHPYLGAAVAGFVCNVVLHRHHAAHRRSNRFAAFDILALVVGISIPWLTVIGTGEPLHQQHPQFAVTLQRLIAITAPWFVGGALLSAVLTALLRRRESVVATRGWRAALAVPWEAATVALGAIGWPFVLALSAAQAAVLRLIAPPEARRSSPSHRATRPTVWTVFDARIQKMTPWLVVGVLAAAYTDPLLEPISFDPLESLAATLALVIAARASTIAAIPVAAILLAHGLSPVVAFIGVVVGWLQAELMRTLGSRLWISTLGLAAGVLGYFASPLTLAVVLAPRALVVDADQSIHWAQWSALALVGAILLVQLWRDGLDGWLSQLSSARSARKRANPPAAAPAAQQR